MTILGLDFGTKSIGYAIGQEISLTAQPIGAIRVINNVPDWVLIDKIIKEWGPQYIIIGMPLLMDGTEQDISNRVRWFAKEINKRFNKTIYLVDETLTTKHARSIIYQNKKFKGLNKKAIDATSAALITEYYLEYNTYYEVIK